MEELSIRTLDAPVPGVMVRELLSISPDLVQQCFGIKRVPTINKEKAKPQINSAKWNDSKKKLYTCASPKCLGLIANGLVEYEILIDLGTELCLMYREVFDELDLPIFLEVDGTVGAVNLQRYREYRICHNVSITVGGITGRCRLYVFENLSQDVILGRPCE